MTASDDFTPAAKPDVLQTAFEQAVQIAATGDVKALRALPQLDKIINRADDEGWTLLMWAAATSQHSTTQFLLSRSAAMDHQGKKGETALICAAETADEKIMALLLNAGARLDLKNNEGQSAFDILKTLGEDALANTLNEQMAKQAVKLEHGITVRSPIVLRKHTP